MVAIVVGPFGLEKGRYGGGRALGIVVRPFGLERNMHAEDGRQTSPRRSGLASCEGAVRPGLWEPELIWAHLVVGLLAMGGSTWALGMGDGGLTHREFREGR